MILTNLAALVILGLFFALEGRTRKGETAASLVRGAQDRNSTVWIGVGLMVGVVLLLLTLVLNYLGLAVVPFAGIVGWLGLGIEVCGIGLRLWANRVLGQFYTRTLRVQSEQTIVQAGPYAAVRHPGYLGMLLAWLGAAVATGNWVGIAIPIVMVGVYLYRIGSEESMMVAQMGDAYAQYQKRTSRLIPFVY